MATHWICNRGHLEIVQGGWDDAGATDLRMGYLEGSSIPAGIDTEAEIVDLNTVAELLAITGVDEPTASGYARMTLDRTNWAEDDTNNRAAADAGDETLADVVAGDEIYGGFIYRHTGGDDSANILWSVWLLDTAVPTNGSDITAVFNAAGVYITGRP